MDYKEKYEEETGQEPYFRDELFGCYGLTKEYCDWLENKLKHIRVITKDVYHDLVSSNRPTHDEFSTSAINLKTINNITDCDIVLEPLNQVIISSDCQKRKWIVTGFGSISGPYNTFQECVNYIYFKHLDYEKTNRH